MLNPTLASRPVYRSMLQLLRSSIVLQLVALWVVMAVLLLAWPGLMHNLMVTQGFEPHGHCYLWIPRLLWLHAFTDASIGIAYVAISTTLAYLVYRARQDIPFMWMFLAFGVFIIACGSTHFLEVVTLWTPVYWLSGYVKLITAAASVATALVLPSLVGPAIRLLRAAKLSEQRKEQLEAANSELEVLYQKTKELDELKSQFFANVSHELRTPLALILGPTERLLNATSMEPEARRSIESVDRNARLLLKHVNDLLDISKLEAGKMQPDYAEVDMASQLRLTTANFESMAVDNGINLIVEAPPVLPTQVDPGKMQRILLNLLSNAFKFTPRGGTIRCILSDDGPANQDITLQVRDSGPGVPVELREAIFERFRQGEGGSTRRFGGTGLGLAIVRDFVQLHGGTIEVGEAPEGGAAFTMRVPSSAPEGATVRDDGREAGLIAGTDEEIARQAVTQLQPTLVTPLPAPNGASARPVRGHEKPLVLVVEDNVEMNNFVAETLANEFRIERAFDGEEGLAKAVDLRPDLIISDMMMPRLSGEQLLVAVRARAALNAVPFILLTAKTDDDVRARLLREGAQDYLMKPFSTEELRARVENQVSMKRVRQVLEEEAAGRVQDLEDLAREVAASKRQAQDTLAALRESEQMQREMADAMPQMVWAARPDGWLDYYNRRWFEYTGMSLDETQGWGWQPMLHPDDLEACLSRWNRAVQSGEPYEIEYRFKRAADGVYRWHLGRALPVRDESGQIRRWFGTATDIDDQKRAEEEKARILQREQAARQEAEVANRAKDDFLATLSHELRTPLTSMLGWVSLLRSGQLDEASTHQALETIERNTRAQARLVEDILEISRAITGKLRLELLPISLAPIVQDAIEIVKPAAEAKGIFMDFDAEPISKPLAGDASRLQQVVWNLLSNAIKFTPRSGSVDISLEERDSQAVLSVRDTGQGIDPAFLPHVFDRFRQGDASNTREHGGLGLGLAIVRHIVELHGGSVEAQSAGINRGATFIIRLPLQGVASLAESSPPLNGAPTGDTLVSAIVEAPGHDEAKANGYQPPASLPDTTLAQHEPNAVDFTGLRVLVVEDDPDTLELIAAVLTGHHALVKEAASVREAVSALRSWRPDIVVSDISMPVEDGYDLMRHLRALEAERNTRIPAAALTALTRPKDRSRALSAGFQLHVSKPVEADELIAVVADLAQRARQRQ